MRASQDIEAYENPCGTWTVRIGGDLFEMNENSLPNGVCIFIGTVSTIGFDDIDAIEPSDMPKGLRSNIARTIRNYRREGLSFYD